MMVIMSCAVFIETTIIIIIDIFCCFTDGRCTIRGDPLVLTYDRNVVLLVGTDKTFVAAEHVDASDDCYFKVIITTKLSTSSGYIGGQAYVDTVNFYIWGSTFVITQDYFQVRNMI